MFLDMGVKFGGLSREDGINQRISVIVPLEVANSDGSGIISRKLFSLRDKAFIKWRILVSFPNLIGDPMDLGGQRFNLVINLGFEFAAGFR